MNTASTIDVIYDFICTLIELGLIDENDRQTVFSLYIDMLDFHLKAPKPRDIEYLEDLDED